MIEALSILHDFTAPFIHRKVLTPTIDLAAKTQDDVDPSWCDVVDCCQNAQLLVCHLQGPQILEQSLPKKEVIMDHKLMLSRLLCCLTRFRHMQTITAD